MNIPPLNPNSPQSDFDNMPPSCVSNTRLLTCCCSSRVLSFFAFLFAVALGIILGAIFFVTILNSLAAVIVGAVILAVIIIALLIFRSCLHCRSDC